MQFSDSDDVGVQSPGWKANQWAGNIFKFSKVFRVLVSAAFVFPIIPAGTFYLLIIVSIPAALVYLIYRYIFKRQELENKRLYQKLLRMAQGDKDLVSRMIENEHRRNPDGNVDEWLSSAIERWQREMR